jgi:hypothetical protein
LPESFVFIAGPAWHRTRAGAPQAGAVLAELS